MPPEVPLILQFAGKSLGNLIYSLPRELTGWAGVNTRSTSVTSWTSIVVERGTRLIKLKVPGVGIYLTPWLTCAISNPFLSRIWMLKSFVGFTSEGFCIYPILMVLSWFAAVYWTHWSTILRILYCSSIKTLRSATPKNTPQPLNIVSLPATTLKSSGSVIKIVHPKLSWTGTGILNGIIS